MVSFFSRLYRHISWCFFAGVALASMEALGFFLSHDGATPPTFQAFALSYSDTCAVLFAVLAAAWLALWLFMVGLGGVRAGMAMLFLLLFFALLAYLVLLLDLVIDYTGKYSSERTLLVQYFAGFSLAVSGVISMVLARVVRRFPRVSLASFPTATGVLVLSGLTAAVWARDTRFAAMPGLAYWGFFAVAALAAVLALRLAARTPVRQGLLTAVLFAVIFAGPRFLPAPAPDGAAAAATGPRPVRRVVLITLDTVRRDALGPYNGRAESSPCIDAFSRDCSVFTNAYSPAPWTYPSVTSMLTGLTPGVHGLHDTKNILPKNVSTLAECMQRAGYRTAAFGMNYMLLPYSGLDRGFAEYNLFPQQVIKAAVFRSGLSHSLRNLAGMQKPDAERLCGEAVQWLGAHAKDDFFLWVHLLDAHTPYSPPAPYQPTDPAQRALGSSFDKTWSARAGGAARTAEERTWVRALYDGEVRYVDAQVGRVLDALRRLDLYDGTLIVVAADHGEEFWDHSRFEHGHTLYNELVRVPLLIKRPGSAATAPIETGVTTRAVMPTILDLCAVADFNREGLLLPLTPLLAGQPDGFAEVPLFIGHNVFHERMEGVVFDQMKYTRERLSGREQLFNLRDDPAELHSLADQDSVNLERGRRLMEEAAAADARTTEQLGIRTEDQGHLNHEDANALQALGYL